MHTPAYDADERVEGYFLRSRISALWMRLPNCDPKPFISEYVDALS